MKNLPIWGLVLVLDLKEVSVIHYFAYITLPVNNCLYSFTRLCGTFGQSLVPPIVCVVYFSFFLVVQKKLSSLRDRTKKFWSVSEFFQSVSHFFVHPLIERLTEKNSETDQNFFVRSLRLDNFFWSTKKNEKKTGQLVDQETDQKYMDAARVVKK